MIKKIYRNLAVLFKPLTIHTEAIVLDNVWEKVKLNANSGKIKKWYVMTPANYEFSRVFLNIKMSKPEFSKKLKERYLWLLNNNQRLELHVHLSPIMNITAKEQEKLILESVNWMKQELNIDVKEFVPGWWRYNADTLKILKKCNLKLIKPADYKFGHDFDWI